MYAPIAILYRVHDIIILYICTVHRIYCATDTRELYKNEKSILVRIADTCGSRVYNITITSLRECLRTNCSRIQ